jgi:hypothetical protein
VHGEKYGQALKTIHLSTINSNINNNAVMRPNGLMSKYIKEKLQTRIKCSQNLPFISENQHVARSAQLLIFVRYPSEGFTICPPLSERPTGSDMFKAGNYCFTTEDVSWANCIGICTGGTAHLASNVEYGKLIAPHANIIYCIVQSEGLESRDLEPTLQFMLQ